MADLSTLRGLLTIVTFLGVLVLLIAYIPPDFYVAAEMREVYVPEEWEGIDLQSYFDTWNKTLSSSGFNAENFDIGGRNLGFRGKRDGEIWLLHRYGFGLWYLEGGEWYNRKGLKVSYISIVHEQIDASILNTDYSSYDDIQFVVKYDSEAVFQVGVHFAFNETLYSSPSDAWDNSELNVLVGIGFDEINTAFNAWDLVGMMLFFQLPDVHPIINALIAIPIWLTIGYLAFMFITRVIPFLGG